MWSDHRSIIPNKFETEIHNILSEANNPLILTYYLMSLHYTIKVTAFLLIVNFVIITNRSCSTDMKYE